VVTNPTHGSLTLNPNGGFSYTPATGYAGPDPFTYRSSDGTAQSPVATVSITVTPTACVPRPKVVPTSAPGAGKLDVHVEATPLYSGRNNSLQRVIIDRLDNARVTLDGRQMAAGQAHTPPATVNAVDFTVERVTAGQPTTVHFTVVDGCGEWKSFVGGGPAAGF
jgi:hypothetical protein